MLAKKITWSAATKTNWSSSYETGYEKSRDSSRNIRFIITKNGENNAKDFVTNMPDGSQMVLTFRTFLLIKKADGRVFKSSNVDGKPKFN